MPNEYGRLTPQEGEALAQIVPPRRRPYTPRRVPSTFTTEEALAQIAATVPSADTRVLPTVGTPSGNDVAPRPGTASSAPITPVVPTVFAGPDEPLPDSRMPMTIEGANGLSVQIPAGIRPRTTRGGVLRRTSAPARPLAALVPTTMAEAEGIMQAQSYLDKKYGTGQANEGQGVEDWKAERRKADRASMDATLDPLRHQVAKNKLEYAAKNPGGGKSIAEFEEAIGMTRDQYVAGKLAQYKRIAAEQNIPFDLEQATEEALASFIDFYGEFRRNDMGRLPSDPYGLTGG